jgi:hypothetical protein
MKPTAMLVLATTLLTSALAYSDVPMIKATELGCHRIERLAFDLKKIDVEYVTKLNRIQIQAVNDGDAKFIWTGSQNPGADGQSNAIELMLDANGKAVGKPAETKGSTAVSPNWPSKDPLSLMEVAVHYVRDNQVTPFYDSISEAVIDQVQQDNETVARVQIQNSQNSSVMEVLIKLDGTLVSTNVK